MILIVIHRSPIGKITEHVHIKIKNNGAKKKIATV